jgi:hypothetical protein
VGLTKAMLIKRGKDKELAYVKQRIRYKQVNGKITN